MANDCPPIDAGRLERAMDSLGAMERAVLLMSASDGLGVHAIAERLGLSAAETRKLLADALCSLHRALERREGPWWRFW